MTARDEDSVDISINVRKVLAIMPKACVVYGFENISNIRNGIGLPLLPFFGNSCPECVKRRKNGSTLSFEEAQIGFHRGTRQSV